MLMVNINYWKLFKLKLSHFQSENDSQENLKIFKKWLNFDCNNNPLFVIIELLWRRVFE